ncbi:MAG: Hsp90xo protein [uncultured Solirubrobacteraceae bacterium]|uniref:Hsp90xo protein n=1 Tax=uncultured Solirubrobacteraceae bacterium TaxID=1162706 RepID=A0A6J4TEY2_9ACTN|nr:MAG: Hsp90xo protein [uncultured Solirubrobacteraceae bacterium]
MAADMHATQVDLGGLMQVLGSHLYSTPQVAIRELVQNAHDSIVRRRIEDDAFAARGGRIDLSSDPAAGVLTIRDDGAGMTRDEVGMFLATVGVGYTRELRSSQPDRADELIGLFGLGFLSAFIVSDKTVVRTTSFSDPSSTVEYRSTTGERYALTDVDPLPVGTEVELHVSPQHRALVDRDALAGIAARYCRLLEIPVHVNGDPTPVNHDTPPWRPHPDHPDGVPEHPVQARKRRLAFADRMDPSFGPLCTMDVEPDDESDAQGLLWIQDAATYGSLDNRRLAIFVRGMLLEDDARDLLPRWAGFVSGAIESRALTPTASREDLQRDEGYQQVERALHEQLISGLAAVARDQPEAWSRVLTRHNEALLGAALVDDRLDALLSEDLQIPTSEGDMTVRELVRRGDGRAHAGLGDGGFEEMRFRALKIPIATGKRYAVVPFVRRWCGDRGIELVELGTKAGDSALFTRATLDDADRAWLAEQLTEDGQELIAASFEPADMPFVIVPDREVELKHRIENDEANARIASAALRLARSYTATVDGEVRSRLYLNVRSPAIGALLDARRHGRDASEATELLKAVLALMAAGDRESTGHVDLPAALRSVAVAVQRLAGAT